MWVVVAVVVIAACVACGGTNASDCASGVACGSGCCANAAEACVVDPATGMDGCLPVCNSRADCATGCCAPLTDGAGNVVGPYVCQSSNVCCFTTVCPGASCCVTDGSGNEFCADKCSSQLDCGGESVCEPFDFSHTSCSGSMACGPPS